MRSDSSGWMTSTRIIQRKSFTDFSESSLELTSSPFLLNATIKQHLQKYANGSPELVKALLNSLFVDDMTSGESTVERGFDLFVNSRKIMAEGRFNLRKWQWNSLQLLCLMQGCDKLSEHEASHQVTKGSFREER